MPQAGLRGRSSGGRFAALWPDAPIQRYTVHKHRNPGSSLGQALLAHAPKWLYDELTNSYCDMIYAETAAEVETRCKAFLRKWRLKCQAVADSLEEAGDRLLTFTRLPPGQRGCGRVASCGQRFRASPGRFVLIPSRSGPMSRTFAYLRVSTPE